MYASPFAAVAEGVTWESPWGMVAAAFLECHGAAAAALTLDLFGVDASNDGDQGPQLVACGGRAVEKASQI
jgi:hypothetical protein